MTPRGRAGEPSGRGSDLFWALYALAWIPYAAGYTVVPVAWEGAPVRPAVERALLIVTPAALLGAGVVALARRRGGARERPYRFAAVHLAAALAYSGLWVLSVDLLFALRRTTLGEPFRLLGFEAGFLRWHALAGLVLYGTVAAGTYLWRTAHRLQGERERAARADALRVRAEIDAIRARLRPHFLFNALHTALSLVRTDPDRAERSLERLGDLLRYAMEGGSDDGARDAVTLGRELEAVRTYLELEAIRLGPRLSVVEEVSDDALAERLPPLTVQPLVENAVRHGVARAPEGGTVEVVARIDGQGERRRLAVTVRDDGPGAPPEEVTASDGTGLALVRRRLRLLHGDDAGLDVETAPGEGFVARIRVPA